MIQIQQTREGLTFPVRVTPRGGQDVVLAFEEGDEWIKVKVACPPEDGQANKAVIALLAKALGVSKSSLSILSGETSRYKRLCLMAPAGEEALQRLAQKIGVPLEGCFTHLGPLH